VRLFRATVIGIVGAAAVLLVPGSAPAGDGTALWTCERQWIWWIPFPCQPESI